MEFEMPICDIRKDDRVYFLESDEWLLVTESHKYMGPKGHYAHRLGDAQSQDEVAPEWVISTLKTQAEWDWNEYPEYGLQANNDFDNGPEYIYPYDVQNEHEYPYANVLLKVAVEEPFELHPDTMRPVRWWAVVDEVDRGYGGPEEGGWWYDIGEVKCKVPCSSEDDAWAKLELLKPDWESYGNASSVIYSGGQYNLHISTKEPRDYPSHRPHYC